MTYDDCDWDENGMGWVVCVRLWRHLSAMDE